MSEETTIDRKRSLSFSVARLTAQLQLLISTGIVALAAIALLSGATRAAGAKLFDLPGLVGGSAAFASAAAFLCRRRWGRIFMLGECALLPFAIAGLWIAARPVEVPTADLTTFGCVAILSFGGAFAYCARDVRAWSEGR